MTIIDPLVKPYLERAGEKGVSVLIVCDASCVSVTAALEREGIRVTSTARAGIGSIGASIAGSQLERLKTIPGILAVELDEEVGILEND